MRINRPATPRARLAVRRLAVAVFVLTTIAGAAPKTSVPDPTISFATYIGSDRLDSVTSLETDASGAVYIAGHIPSDATSFWAAQFTSFGQAPANSPICYFAKLIPDGSGGLTYDYAAIVRDGFGCGVMAVAPNGDVALSGSMSVLNSVVRHFSSRTGTLIQTTVFAVPLQTVDHMRVDAAGRTYAVGLCAQEDQPGTLWPLPNGAQPNPMPGLCTNPNAIGGLETQETLLVTDANGLMTYGTFIGTSASALDVTALDVDASGRAWVAGHTQDGLVHVTGDAFQPQSAGAYDAFIAAIDPALAGLNSLTYASYFGGSGIERDIALAVHPSGTMYLAGNTETRIGFPGRDFIDPAIFLSILDLSQPPPNQLLSTAAVVESPLTSLYGNFETTPAMRLLANGSIAFLADSVDSLFPLVAPLYSGPYDPTKPNPLRPLLLVYDPAASAFTLATFLDDVQQARFPRVVADAAGSLYVAMTTAEANRSTDASAPLGLGDVLLFAIGGQATNQPPTVSIPDALNPGAFTVYADSSSGGTLQLNAVATDPDGDALTFSWTGPFIDNPVTTNNFLIARVALGTGQTVTVTVDDGHGNVVSASRTFDVVGTPFAGGTATPVDSTLNGLMLNYAPLTITPTAIVAGGGNVFLRSRLDRLPAIPADLQAGSPPIYFDVSTDAAFVAPIDVCIDTSGMSFASPGAIRLYHSRHFGQLAAWVDITSPGYPQGNRICGQSTALGTFAILYPQVPATAVQTIAGSGVLQGSNDGVGGSPIDDYMDGPATATALNYLLGGAYDRANNRLFVSDGIYILRVNLTTNTITRVAGNGIGILGSIDGAGGDSRDDIVEGGDAFDTYVGSPFDLALSPTGDVLFFDNSTCRVRRLDLAQGRLFAVAGNGTCGFSGDGSSPDQASISRGPVAFDAAGHLFLADLSNARVRRIDAQTNTISTVVGDGTFGTPVNGAPALSPIGMPTGMAFDSQGHLLVAAGLSLVRVSTGAADALVDGDADEAISVIGRCKTNCQLPFNGDGQPISHPQVYLPGINALTVARDGAVLLSDYYRIRRIGPGADGIVTGANDEIITTIGGYYELTSGSNFNGDSFATQSAFSSFKVIVEDDQGRVIVVDGDNYRVRRFGIAPAPVNPNSADVSVVVSATPDPVDTGASLRYFVIVTNDGPAPASAVTMTYAMPAGALFESVGSGNGVSCTGPAVGSAGTVTCDFGTLTSGASNAIPILVKPQSAGSLSSTFVVAAAQVDPNIVNNTSRVSTTVNLAPVVIEVSEVVTVADTIGVLPSAVISVTENITVADAPGVLPSAMIGVTENVTVTDGPAIAATTDLALGKVVYETYRPDGRLSRQLHTVENGGQMIFNLQIVNRGSGNADAFTVTDVLPNGLTFVAGSQAGTGNYPCGTVGQVVTCSANVPLQPGSVFDFMIRVSVGSVAAPGQPVAMTNTATLAFAADADPSNNSGSDSFTVIHADTVAPSIRVPELIDVPGTSPAGAVVTFSASAVDDLDVDPPVVSCVPASGATFPVGTTTVSCTATDSAGNQATDTFTVTVQPYVPPPPPPGPDLDLPGNLTAVATSAAGAVVTYTATATVSAFGGSFTFPAFCLPPSGSTFPIGTTTVTCTATSPFTFGTSTGTFTVTVIAGVPRLRAVVAAKGRDSAGNYFVDLFVTNDGNGHARHVSITSLIFRTLVGAGVVTHNPVPAGPLPLQVGSIDAGSAQVVRLDLNVPANVFRFAITEIGTMQDLAGGALNFSFGQAVIK